MNVSFDPSLFTVKLKRQTFGPGSFIIMACFGAIFMGAGLSTLTSEGGGQSEWFTYIFPVVGLGIIGVALYMFVRSIQRGSAIKRLTQTGYKTQGVMVDMQMVGTNNRGTLYRVVVTATDPQGVVQNYTSDTLSGIGSLGLMDFRTNPIPVHVYIDTARPQNYYVDISDLPSMTPQRIQELAANIAKNKPWPPK